MPAYNEAGDIRATVEALCSRLDVDGWRYELIIVDDASTDETPDIVAELSREYPAVQSIRNDGPNGYGNAIKVGLDRFTGTDIVIVTSDGSDAPDDVATYFREIEKGVECVFGSRFDGRAKVQNYPAVKRVVNRVANTLVGWLCKSRYRDFTNGFKCYRRDVIDGLRPILSGHFNITIELSVGAVLAGRSVTVIPTDWKQREEGESSFRILNLVKPYSATLLYCLCRSYLTKSKR